MAENISQQSLDVIKKYYAYKNQNMPETVPDSIIKEATEWHKNNKSFESDKDNKLEKDDKDKIKDFFNNQGEKNISNDENGNLRVKLKNNEQITYNPRGISFDDEKNPSVETIVLGVEAYATTEKGKDRPLTIISNDPVFVAKALVAFEEKGIQCKNISEFEDNKYIQTLRKKYKQERAVELEAKGKTAGNAPQTVSSTRTHIENLSRNGQNPNLTPKEATSQSNPSQEKSVNANDTLKKVAREKMAGLKR